MIEVLRGGAKARLWSRVVGANPPPRAEKGKVTLRYQMSAAGGGWTNVMTRIDPGSFDDLCDAMLQAHPERAELAMLRTLLKARMKGAS